MNKVKDLVYDQYNRMNLANKSHIPWDMKRDLLSDSCQNIIYYQWGMGTQGLWDEINKWVEVLILEED